MSVYWFKAFKFSVLITLPFSFTENCQEALAAGHTTGEVDLQDSGGNRFKVFCIFYKNQGKGYAFLSREAVTNSDSVPINLTKLYTKDSEALVRVFRTDDTRQRVSRIKFGVNSDRALRFGINSAEGFEGPSLTTPYLLLGIPGKNPTSETQSKSGFRSNGQYISITNCSGDGNSYFAFYSDLQDEDLPPYRQPSSSYSKWNNSIWSDPHGMNVKNTIELPYNYRFQVEINFGGCQSDFSNSWGEFEAAALGLYFTSKTI